MIFVHYTYNVISWLGMMTYERTGECRLVGGRTTGDTVGTSRAAAAAVASALAAADAPRPSSRRQPEGVVT